MAIRVPKDRKKIMISVPGASAPLVQEMVAQLARKWGGEHMVTRHGQRGVPNRSTVMLRCLDLVYEREVLGE